MDTGEKNREEIKSLISYINNVLLIRIENMQTAIKQLQDRNENTPKNLKIFELELSDDEMSD